MPPIDRAKIKAYGDWMEDIRSRVEQAGGRLWDIGFGFFQFMYKDSFMVYVKLQEDKVDKYWSVAVVKRKTWKKIEVSENTEERERLFANAVKRGGAKTFCCSTYNDIFRTLGGKALPYLTYKPTDVEVETGRKVRL